MWWVNDVPEPCVLPKDPFEGKVKCDECKHYIDRYDAQKVTIDSYMCGRSEICYCPVHKKPYDQIDRYSNIPIYYKTMMRVSEEGIPIGFIPEPESETPNAVQ